MDPYLNSIPNERGEEIKKRIRARDGILVGMLDYLVWRAENDEEGINETWFRRRSREYTVHVWIFAPLKPERMSVFFTNLLVIISTRIRPIC